MNCRVYTLWLPEQYDAARRASAFATSSGRFAGAGVQLTSIALLIGMLLLPLGVETKGRPLPS